MLAVRLRLELRNRLSPIEGLAILSNTIMGPHLKLGSPAWDRTTDTLINSQVQLPLCYWGIIYLVGTHAYYKNMVEQLGVEPRMFTTRGRIYSPPMHTP